MEAFSNSEKAEVPNRSAIRSFEDIDFESSHRIINAFMESVQRSFSKETNYKRPLLAPQANIAFALDGEVAAQMTLYMTTTLINVAGFTADEFSLTQKASVDGVGLQRIRLEFRDGVTRVVLWKIFQATDKLSA